MFKNLISALTFSVFLIACKNTQKGNDFEPPSPTLCELESQFAYIETLQKPFKTEALKERSADETPDVMVVAVTPDDEFNAIPLATKQEIVRVVTETDLLGDFLTKALISRAYFYYSCNAKLESKQIKPLNELYKSNFSSCMDNNDISDNLELCMKTFVESH